MPVLEQVVGMGILGMDFLDQPTVAVVTAGFRLAGIGLAQVRRRKSSIASFGCRFVQHLAQAVADSGHAHGMSEEEKQSIIDGGNWSYLWLGATHMLSGYDHLAFVFGIIFFLTTFRDIAKYVTAFTVGHSLTIILSLSSPLLFAHSDGHGQPREPVDQQQAEQAANGILAELLTRELIEASWGEVEVASAEKKSFGGQME